MIKFLFQSIRQLYAVTEKVIGFVLLAWFQKSALREFREVQDNTW